MHRSLRPTLAVLGLLLFVATSFCPCAMMGSTRETAGSLQHAPGKAHCSQNRSEGSHQSRPGGPCGSDTCRNCPTDFIGLPHASSTSSLTLTVLPVHGEFSITPLPAPSTGRAGSVANDLPPPKLSRPILELNCCFLI